MGALSDLEKVTMLFDPCCRGLKGVDFDALLEEVGGRDSEEYYRLWDIWDGIYQERHADLDATGGCADRYCDECGRYFMGDGW